MPFRLDDTRWSAIESLPLPTGVGNLTDGLSAVARIVYAATGKVSDMADATCIPPTIRAYVIALNDRLPADLRQRLGSREIADRVLAADTSAQAEQRRAYLYADHAVRVSAVAALRAARLDAQADTLAALAPIVDRQTDARAAADAAYAADARAAADAAYAAADAAYAAADAAYAAADAAARAAYAAARAAYAAYAAAAYAADAYAAARAAYAADAYAAARAAYAADAYAADAADAAYATWEPAFDLLDALLAA